MLIKFEKEAAEIVSQLKSADGYLDSEVIVLTNINKHVANGIKIPAIESYLKKLQTYFEDKTVINKDNTVAVNYKYAAAFLKTINATPYWHSWS